MKFKKTSIFLVSLLSLLTSCGNKSIAGTYGFQMGKEKGTHFGFSLTLTEEASTIEGVPSDAKKCAHYPLIYMQMSWVDSHKDAPLGTHIFVTVCIFMLAILVAYGAYRLYDLPVREWLKHKLFKQSAK